MMDKPDWKFIYVIWNISRLFNVPYVKEAFLLCLLLETINSFQIKKRAYVR